MASLDSESYMDLPVQKVAVSGPILANIVQDLGTCSGDCDGVLFGRLERTVSSNLQDDDEQPRFREQLTAIITGFYCSGTLFSFYDATGLINSAKLAKLIGDRESRGGDPVIGWFVGRRNSPMRPSMRETAVTRYLRLSATAQNQEGAGLSKSPASPGGSRNIRENHKILKTDGAEATHLTDGSPKASSRTSSQSSGVLRDELRSSPSKIGGSSSPIELDTPVSDVGMTSKSKVFCDSLHSGLSNTVVRPGGVSSPVDVDTDNVDRPPISQATKGSQAGVCASGALSKSVWVPPSSPCLFLLFTESGAQQAVHTHDYRGFQYHLNSRTFEPRTVSIVNIGPAFRVQYDSFSPVVPFPFLSSGTEGEDDAQSWSSSVGSRTKWRELHESSRKPRGAMPKEQALLDMYSEGYNVERLASFVGPDGMRQGPELEDLYGKMLSKLETLAKQVCESSSALVEQEKINAQMRLRFTSLE